MTLTDIATMVGEMADAVGGSYNYLMWPENSAPDPPYILFYYPNRADFMADNINYSVITTLNIEFYSNEKDFAGESSIEAILAEYEIPYTKDESYHDDEKLYEILYTMEVTINE